MTADPAAATPTEPKPMALDTAVVPLGERALRQILKHVVAVGDEAETTYLEVKSELDLSGKLGVAKVAKFLLGAANRRPKEAVHHFHDYAVLAIGARKGSAPGVPRGVEAHELEDRLQPYLGPQFPPFEFGRISVDSDREVLFIIAQPPEDGQTIFPCHKNFQGDDRRDNLEDGAVYVRGASNTRPARAGEIQTLVERARGGGKPPIDLGVEILGSISRVNRVDELMEELYEDEEKEFIKHQKLSAFAHTSPVLSLVGGPRPLSDKARTQRLQTWRKNKHEHLNDGKAHFLGAALPGTGIRVVSRDRFVARPELTVTFHGCEVFDHVDAGDADLDKVVKPVVRDRSHYRLALVGPEPRYYVPRDNPVTWNNHGNDAEVTLTLESLRPNATWTSDEDDYVIVLRDPNANSVTVSWVLTEDGSNDVTSGELTIPLADLIDAADLHDNLFPEDD